MAIIAHPPKLQSPPNGRVRRETNRCGYNAVVLKRPLMNAEAVALAWTPQPRISNHNPLDLVECKLIVAPVVQTCCARAVMIRHLLRDFQLAALRKYSLMAVARNE